MGSKGLTFAILLNESSEKLVLHDIKKISYGFQWWSLVSDLKFQARPRPRSTELWNGSVIWHFYLVIITFVFQDLAPKTIRQVPSWSSSSSSASSLSRPVSSASSFEKFRQQARDKEERVSYKSKQLWIWVLRQSLSPSQVKEVKLVHARDRATYVLSQAGTGWLNMFGIHQPQSLCLEAILWPVLI